MELVLKFIKFVSDIWMDFVLLEMSVIIFTKKACNLKKRRKKKTVKKLLNVKMLPNNYKPSGNNIILAC